VVIGPRLAGRRLVRYQLSATAARRVGEALDVALDPVEGETVAQPAQPASSSSLRSASCGVRKTRNYSERCRWSGSSASTRTAASASTAAANRR